MSILDNHPTVVNQIWIDGSQWSLGLADLALGRNIPGAVTNTIDSVDPGSRVQFLRLLNFLPLKSFFTSSSSKSMIRATITSIPPAVYFVFALVPHTFSQVLEPENPFVLTYRWLQIQFSGDNIAFLHADIVIIHSYPCQSPLPILSCKGTGRPCAKAEWEAFF